MIDYQHILHRLRETRVLQNYSYMSALQVGNALISVLIYPYLIRVMGADAMGLYAFILGIVMYFQAMVEFGFDMPAAKAVSLAHDQPHKLNRIISQVWVCKWLLLVTVSLLAVPIVWWIPILRRHVVLFMVIYAQIIYSILFPQWYYQGMKNMRFSTIVQFCIRLLQIPLIIWLVHDANDVIIYAAIVSGTLLLGGLVGGWNIYREGRRWVWVSWQELWQLFHEVCPFFITNISATIKERTLTTLIGVFLGMREVAIYDLAMKVVQIPRLLINSVNGALFPEVVANATPHRVRAILHYERWIGILAIGGVILLGYPTIWILGGKTMLAAYPVAVILACTIYSFLVVGAYLQFVFIAQGRYSIVAQNQLIAMTTCVLLGGLGMWIYPAAWIAALALVLSGGVEIIYCRTKYKN